MNKAQHKYVMRGLQPPLDRTAERAALALDLKLKGAKWKDVSKLCQPRPSANDNTPPRKYR